MRLKYNNINENYLKDAWQSMPVREGSCATIGRDIVRIKPGRDLFLLARTQCGCRKEIIIELRRIGKVDVPVLQCLNLCPVCF